MRPAFLLVSLLAASVLAGCAGKAPAVDDLAGPVGETGQALAGAKPFTTLHYSGAPRLVHEVVWANGTVNAQDTCNLGGCVLDYSKAMHATDLTGFVVQGAPTLVTIVLDWNANPVGFGGWDAFLDAPDATVYTRRQVSQPGHIESQAVLRPAGSVSAILMAYGPGGDATTAYTMRITVDAHPQALLPGVPVSVALEGGDTVRASSYGGGDAAFLLYGPGDERLGLYQGRHTLPSSAPAGHYVVLFPFGGPTGNLSADSGAEAMDAVGLRQEPGAWSSVPPGSALDAAWEVTGVPVGVGVNARSGDDLAVSPFAASLGLSARLEGPGGYVLDLGEVCGLCVTGGFSYSADSGSGDPAILPGGYTLHAESQAAVGFQLQPFAIYLER